MATRIKGKKMAAGITATIAVGSFAVVGIGAVAVDQTTGSHTPGTSSVSGSGGGATPDQGLNQGSTQDGNSYNGGYSGGNSVLPGNGGSVSGRSSGS